MMVFGRFQMIFCTIFDSREKNFYCQLHSNIHLVSKCPLHSSSHAVNEGQNAFKTENNHKHNNRSDENIKLEQKCSKSRIKRILGNFLHLHSHSFK